MKKILLLLMAAMIAFVASSVTYIRVKFNNMPYVFFDVDKVEKAYYEKDAINGYRYMLTKTINGEVYKYDIDRIDEVTYIEGAPIVDGVSVSGEVDGYSYVDLELPSGLKWATFNVGAKSPTEGGDFITWGETSRKEDYTWETYKWGTGFDYMTKYCMSSSQGVIDGKSRLEPEDDAAVANWGGNWRMPTLKEQKELIDGCRWNWTANFNGSKVAGYIGTSKTNGNVIFLPATGMIFNKTSSDVNNSARYLASDVSKENNNSAYCIFLYRNTLKIGDIYRYYGQSVRAVNGEHPQGDTSYHVRFFIDNSTVLNEQYVEEGKAAVEPKVDIPGNVFIGWSDSSFLNVQRDLDIYAKIRPLGQYTVRFFSKDSVLISSINVTENNTAKAETAPSVSGYRFIGWDKPLTNITSDLDVYAQYAPVVYTSGSFGDHDFVDLGLPSGLKWATYNVGAKSITEYGGYYSWGETTTKSVYDWLHYKWNAKNSSIAALTKYCNRDGGYGTIDGKSVLEEADDAVIANWGDIWRMPTESEIKELYNNCTWSSVKNFQDSGVNGWLGTSKKNGNVIFFPSAGYRYDKSSSGVGIEAYIWSNTILSSYNPHAVALTFMSKCTIEGHYRNNGASVRAVTSLEYKPEYTVNFYTSDSTLIESQVVKPGKSATAPEAPALEGYDFIGWSDTSFVCVVKDMNIYAKYRSSETSIVDGVSVSGKVGDYDYVDLGLKSGLKWATRNVGATKVTEGGAYIAWGETSEKEVYSWSTYKFGSMSEITKYVDGEYADNYDKKTVLEAGDDAASINWGSTWRMPTKEDMMELIDGCDWKWVENFNACGQYNYGMVGTSKYNGNIIYLPAVGNRYGDDLGNTSIEAGFYWTSNLLPNTMLCDDAYYLVFGDYIYPPTDDYSLKLMSGGRDYGYSVRAVTK